MIKLYINSFILFLFCILVSHQAFSQATIKIGDAPSVAVFDGDHFYDSGGKNRSYKNNENYTINLEAPSGYDLAIEFTSFRVVNRDVLSIFDNTNFMGNYTDYNNPGRIEFPSGIAKFDFTSTGRNRDSGWEAVIHLTPKTSSNIRISDGGSHLVNEPIRFYDSGGANLNYPDMETSSINFSAPAGYDLVVHFISYNTEAGYDYLKISDGVSPLDELDDVNDDLKVVSSTGNLKFDFKSDRYVNESGWEAIVYKRERPADLIFADSDVAEDAGSATVRVSLSKLMSSDVSFEWCTGNDQAQQPSDYTRVTWNSVKINAGESYVDLSIVIKDDNVYEGNEKFTVFIKNSVNAKIINDRISCTIIDNESAPPELSISDISVDEDAGIAIFKARLNKVSTKNVRFNWITVDNTARQPNDYIRVGWTQATIPAGQLFVDLEVAIVDDRIHEDNQDFICDITSPSNASINVSRAYCTIIDNDSDASIEIDKKNPENNYSASDLVQQVLVTGCLTASGVTYQGNENEGIGYFDAGASDFPLSSGIIISTGNVNNANGPSSSFGSDDLTGIDYVDTDVKEITGDNSFDAQVLEFDFVPAGDKLEFSYVFASDEYETMYACTDYNDVFAFIISGPGIINDVGLSGKNIALTNTGDDVSIKNVYDPACFGSPNNSDLYVDETGIAATRFNGRTKVLKAKANVQACETYHIRLIISDVNDSGYNSAVFLEANSFVSNEVLVENRLDDIDGDKDVMYRGCDKSFISFSRKERLDEEYSFGVTITGSAVNGVDYYLLNPDGSNAGKFPEQITFPIGVSELKYYYMASDAVTGEKDILFEVLIGCPCNPDDADYFRKTVKIFDIAEIEASAVSNVTCNGGSAIATVIIKLKENLDPDNYLYSLDGSAFQSSNRFQGNFTVGDHQVVIKDIFSCKSKEVTINIPAPTALKADAGENFEMCEQDDTKELDGKGGIDYLWTCDKLEGLKDMDLTVPNPKISPLVSADIYTYTLTVSDGIGKACSSSDDVEVKVMATPTLSLSADKLEVCSGTDISLNADVKKATNAIYQWTPIGEINHANQQNVIATPVTTIIASRTYSLEVTSDNGCHVKQSISGIQVSPLPIVALNTTVSNLCSDGTNGVIKLNVSGGTPEAVAPLYHYSWSHDALVDTDMVSGLAPNTYTVTVSDSKACQSQIDVVLKSEPKPKGIFVD